MRKIGKLCVITDETIQNNYSHIEITKFAIKGGADMVQFRDKKMPTDELVYTAKEMAKLCRKANVQFIVNDRVDVAMYSNADGVHLGNNDIPIMDARKLLGFKKIIGGTAHNLKEALKVFRAGADYIGYGHIFPTRSIIKTTKPKGVRELERICNMIRIPLLAIGGIDINNIKEVVSTGVHGVAVLGAVVNSINPQQTVREIKICLDEK